MLTKTLAKKIFNDISVAVGKTISFGNEPNMVTGVIEDVPVNSHFTFSALRAMPANLGDNWNNGYLYTYILLKNKDDIKKLEAKMPAFVDKYIKPAMGTKVSYQAELQPVTSIHLNSNLDYEIGANGRMSYIYIFSLVAALILIIASINYMNLSTARSSLRIKEIGIRKVSGSGRGQLIIMFLAESVLITLIASVLATGILNLSMPLFQHFIGKEIDMWRFGVWQTLLMLTGFSVFAAA